MKKLCSLLLIFLCLVCVGCTNPLISTTSPSTTAPVTTAPTSESVSVKIGYLSGSTGLGMAKLIADSRADADSNLTFLSYSSPAEAMAAIAAGSIDFACLPTNAFPNFYKNMNQTIRLAAINTLGVLYITTNGENISSLADLSGKTVYVPEAAPKLVLQYLLDLYEVTDVTLDMEYDLDTLPPAHAAGNAKIALLPEPKVTVATNLAAQSSKTVTVALDLSALWSAKSESPLTQGALLVSNTFASAHPDAVDSFLSLYEASIEYMAEPSNLDSAAQYAVDAGILPNLKVAKSAIPRCNLAFICGSEMKTAASGFFTALGIAVPSGSWCYEAD